MTIGRFKDSNKKDFATYDTVAELEAAPASRFSDGAEILLRGIDVLGDINQVSLVIESSALGTDSILLTDGRYANFYGRLELTFTTIADLVDLSFTNLVTDGQEIKQTGFYTDGDFGQPLSVIYTTTKPIVSLESGVWVSNGTNNGAAFGFLLANGGYASVFATGAINPRWVGAKADATTDDRNVVQLAINIARETSGKVVFIGGNWRLDYGYGIELGLNNKVVALECRGGAILYGSLPEDYTLSNWSAQRGETYTTKSLLRGNGTYATSTHDMTGINLPWNGKQTMFRNSKGCQFLNMKIDFGWGNNPDRPVTIKPIKGISFTNIEFIYYSTQFTFGTSLTSELPTIHRNCEYLYNPGTCITNSGDGGDDASYTDANIFVENVKFREWGDHCIYFGNASRVSVKNCDFYADMAASGSDETNTFVFETVRHAIKFYGAKQVDIKDSTVDTNIASFLSLSVEPERSELNCEDVYVAYNIIGQRSSTTSSLVNISCTDRIASQSDGSGYRLKNLLIEHNTFNAIYIPINIEAALENCLISHNTFANYDASTCRILIVPKLGYAHTWLGLNITFNNFETSSNSQEALWFCGGFGENSNVNISNNSFRCASSLSKTTSPFAIRYVYTYPMEGSFTVSNNQTNGRIFINIPSPSSSGTLRWRTDWLATETYTGLTGAFNNGAESLTQGRVVYYSGNWYVANQNITGNAGNTDPSVDTARWDSYTRKRDAFSVSSNTMLGTYPATSLNFSTWIVYNDSDRLPIDPYWTVENNVISRRSSTALQQANCMVLPTNTEIPLTSDAGGFVRVGSEGSTTLHPSVRVVTLERASTFTNVTLLLPEIPTLPSDFHFIIHAFKDVTALTITPQGTSAAIENAPASLKTGDVLCIYKYPTTATNYQWFCQLYSKQAAIADLNQTIGATYDQVEVQAISDKVDVILASMRSAGAIGI